MAKQRDSFFDIARAVAMLLVVMQHCFLYFNSGEWQDIMFNRMSNLCSVPLFMFISGYFNYSSQMGKGKFTRRLLTLILPFIVWSTIYFFYDKGFQPTAQQALDFLISLAEEPYFSPIWFLRTLFLIILIEGICRKLFPRHRIIAFIGAYLIIVTMTIFITEKFALKSLTAQMPWFIAGYFCHSRDLFQRRGFRIFCALCLPTFIAIMLLKGHYVAGPILSTLFKLATFTGIFALLFIIRIAVKLADGHTYFIEKVGRETLEIYCVHYSVIWILNDYLRLNVTSVYPLLTIGVYMFTVVPLTLLAVKYLKSVPILNRVLFYRRGNTIPPSAKSVPAQEQRV